MCDEKKKKVKLHFTFLHFQRREEKQKYFFNHRCIYIFLTKYFMNELYILVILEENNF